MASMAPVLYEVGQYAGQAVVEVFATQLGDRYSASRARSVLREWIEFLAAGPTPIRELDLMTRTPKRLFTALAAQVQLEALRVKWGDYDDLSVLAGLSELHTLVLGGASAVRSVEPLRVLQKLASLEIEDLRHVHDLAPLADLPVLTSLTIGGRWASFENVRLDSLSFLRAMPQLEHLVLHTAIVDDGDYSPLLALPRLRSVRVMATRGMSPTIDELRSALPWDG